MSVTAVVQITAGAGRALLGSGPLALGRFDVGGFDVSGFDAWTDTLPGGPLVGVIMAGTAVVVVAAIIVRTVRLSAARASLRTWAQRVGASRIAGGEHAERFAALVGEGRVLQSPAAWSVRSGGVESLAHTVHLSIPQGPDRTSPRAYAVAWGRPVAAAMSLQATPVRSRVRAGLGQVPVRSGDAALDAVWIFHTAATRIEDGVPEPVRRALHAALEPAAGPASAMRRATLRLDGGEAVLWRRGPADGAFAEAAAALFARLAG